MNTKDLKNAIKRVTPIARNSFNSNIKISIKDGLCTVAARSQMGQCEASFSCDDEELQFCTNFEQLVKGLGLMRLDLLSIKNANDKLYLSSGKASFSTPTSPVDEGEFLDIPAPESSYAIHINPIKRLIPFAAKDEIKASLTFIYLHEDKIVATDGHVLGLVDTAPVPEPIKIPTYVASMMEGVCRIYPFDRYTVMKEDDFILAYLQPEAIYPDYSRVIPAPSDRRPLRGLWDSLIALLLLISAMARSNCSWRAKRRFWSRFLAHTLKIL
jgi:DNA polymerase III sliding clamp (beta) subunit (PCNA family)